ncbi:MAG: PKD domain-containing protein [Bacteroidetes bacterium]|nr:PKD domain-containing protein [Bacteroidota bacterium]
MNDTICKGQSITFSIKDTSDVLGYLWDFGDGTTSPGISPVTHTYNINPPSGTTNVSLVLWSPDSACTAVATNPIYIFPVIAEFSIGGPDSLFCLNEQITFTNTSTNATSNNWNFGDGTSHNGLTPPPHTFPAPGSYTVTLGISNSSTGCNDTISKTLIILPLPEAIAAGGDTCQGNPVQLSSSGGIAYSWSPATGLNNDTIQNPLATPNVSTNYTVTVTDVNGCTDNAVANVIIYLPPATVQFDTAMVIGQTYQLNVDQVLVIVTAGHRLQD